MHIAKFQIKNFKLFRDVTLHFNPRMNVLTGVNNSGKTTVLEALALWHECFEKLLYQTKRKETKTKTKPGDYRLGSSTRLYFSADEIRSIRSPHFEDLFHNAQTAKGYEIELRATLVNSQDNITLEIPFLISGGRRSTYDISCPLATFERFNQLFVGYFPQPISTVFTSPFSNILPSEEFKTRPKIKEMIQDRLTSQVMRNRLHNLTNRLDRYGLFRDLLGEILSDKQEGPALLMGGRIDSDVNCRVDIDLHNNTLRQDLSLVGSGTIQIIEILLSVLESSSRFSIALLDEPDSHLHRAIQNRLYNGLNNLHDLFQDEGTSLQLFLTTHNESLIRAANPEFVFHLENKLEANYKNILYNTPAMEKRGLQPTVKQPILKDLGSETALELVTALESDVLYLVEGKTDAYFFQALFKNHKPVSRSNRMFWSYDGINTILKSLKTYRTIFSSIRNQRSLWDKSVLILDKDYFTNEQCQFLEKGILESYGLPTIVWRSSMTEASLLEDLNNLARILVAYQNDCRPDDKQSEHEIKSEIYDLLKTTLEDCCDTYTALLQGSGEDSQKFELKYKRQMELRQKDILELIPKADSNSNPFKGSLDELWWTFKREALDHLQNSKMHYLASKADVLAILNRALAPFDLTFDDNDFPQLFDAISRPTKMPSWDPFLKQ